MNEDKSPKVCPLLKQHCLESRCAWYMALMNGWR